MIYKSKYNQLAVKLKPFIPAKLRTIIRKNHQNFIFKKALKEFSKHYENIENREDLLIDLIYGYGNLGWSAMENYLMKVLIEVLKTKGPILECGSGLSTLLMGIIAEKRGIKLYTLEHQEVWANKVKINLQNQGVNCVEVYTCTIKDYGDFEWYEVPMKEMPDNFALVICDGPPGQTKGGRYGLLPVMEDSFSDSTIILFDDYSRKGEQDVVARWGERNNLKVDVFGDSDVYATIAFEKDKVAQKI